MTEQRFYIHMNYVCPQCGNQLLWERRPGTVDSMMLVHDTFECKLKGKRFYAPVQHLTEIPDDQL